jgi:hypothetical protein
MLGYPCSLFNNLFMMSDISNAFGILRKISLDFERILQRVFAKKPPLAPTVDPIASFIIARHRKLTRTFKNGGEEYQNFSSNIDAVFYTRKELNKVLLVENNHLEKEWKTRIMIDSTPRGNLIMFYDVYKQGFAYYSDQNSMPYSVLNGAAMKYVVMFGCRDFYMDENFLPEEYPSPLAKIFLEDEKPDSENNDDIEANKKGAGTGTKIKTKPEKIDTKSGPFAKLKNYRFDEKKQAPQMFFNAVQQQHHSFFALGAIALTNLFRWSIIGLRRTYYRLFIRPSVAAIKHDAVKTDVEKKPVKEKYVNKFINMGKTYNFSFLQKMPVAVEDTWASVDSTRFDGFFCETNSRSVVGSNVPTPLPRTVTGTVRSSAVCKNPNLSMSWQQYKTKIIEGNVMI